MKQTRNIARQCFASILSAIVATLILKTIALGQVTPSWVPTGSLNIARSNYTATLLADGRVLVVGGYSYVDYNNLSSAELYDPATGTWGSTGSLNISRSGHTATLLANGKVLVVGGDQAGNGAELYDPSSGTWSVTGSLNIARSGHTATLLQSGKVLVAGGGGGDGRAELYDPATGTWSITGGLITDRGGQTATLLQNGQVLIAGGWFDEGDGIASFVASAELYDPATGTWSVTGNLNAPRSSHTATLLPDGRVLIAAGGFDNWAPDKGGFAVSPTSLNSAELYDPATGTWSVTASLKTLRTAHTATLLPNGKVLVAGGYYWTTDGNTPNDGTFPCGDIWTCRAKALDTAEIYDPVAGNWSATVNLNAACSTATRLQNGQVLCAGGDSLGSAELYESPVTLWAAVLPSSRSVQVGTPATAFATIINTDSNMATGCAISPITNVPATLAYQTTDPATNLVTGAPNTLVDIPAGAAQSFVLALTPTAPMAPTDVQLSFDCANTDPAPIIPGLNTLLFSASATPTPDIMALVATLSGDGIVNIPGTNGTGIFAVATVNMGAGDTLTVSADTGGAALPVNVFICQTDPKSGVCLSPPDSSVTTTILSNETPTFGIFVAAQEDISFFPEINRIFVRFEDSGGITRGLTSVAVRTQ
jgi:hypothetical protein